MLAEKKVASIVGGGGLRLRPTRDFFRFHLTSRASSMDGSVSAHNVHSRLLIATMQAVLNTACGLCQHPAWSDSERAIRLDFSLPHIFLDEHGEEHEDAMSRMHIWFSERLVKQVGLTVPAC